MIDASLSQMHVPFLVCVKGLGWGLGVRLGSMELIFG
jgi:hypothetical protein